jgi:hypothetical protein
MLWMVPASSLHGSGCLSSAPFACELNFRPRPSNDAPERGPHAPVATQLHAGECTTPPTRAAIRRNSATESEPVVPNTVNTMPEKILVGLRRARRGGRRQGHRPGTRSAAGSRRAIWPDIPYQEVVAALEADGVEKFISRRTNWSTPSAHRSRLPAKRRSCRFLARGRVPQRRLQDHAVCMPAPRDRQ